MGFKNRLVYLRNGIFGFAYRNVLKHIFFLVDPEKIHNWFIEVGRLLGSNFLTRGITSFFFNYSDRELEQEILGIRFRNPVGLAAGFDKNGRMIGVMPCVGFGFMEIGSVTGERCSGNPKPRLWRLKKSKGLVVYYGLMNDGCEAIARRLRGRKTDIVLGVSIAKTNSPDTVEIEAGIRDYVKAYRNFVESGVGDYYTINISCPNAFGGQPFHEEKRLDKLLGEIEKIDSKKPIFLKVSPDLSKGEIDRILKVAGKHRVDGFVLTNLTKIRNGGVVDWRGVEKGGISGKPLEDMSNDVILYIYRKTRGKYVIIGCGGVFSAEDAYRKIRNGASLIELITGMIFEGPQVISSINMGLARLLKRDGFSSIREAVGADAG